MIKKLIDIIFPESCVICGRIYSKPICPKCFIKLKKEINFYKIKEKEFNIFFLSFYEGTIKKLILDFKFKESGYLYNFFTELFIRNNQTKELIQKYDYTVPVPMYYENKIIRGYNQIELITKKLEQELGIKELQCLEKVKKNKKQSLLTEKERIKNVKDVYKLKNDTQIKNKKILLIDDIYTTGSTTKECIKKLKEGRPKKIDVLVISKSKKG
ncbi:MAG: ComF family protein [Clostridia bacterium]|nr:ComF family protein [Clostridia bacterium]